MTGRTVTAVLVPERKPSDESWIELCRALDVALAWPDQFEELDRLLTLAPGLEREEEQ